MKNYRFRCFLTFSLCLLLLSCHEEQDPIHILPPVEGGDWEIFKLAKIYVEDIPVEVQSFSGSIENVPVSLGRIPGDTLVFIIPNVGEGPAQLTFNMGKQIKTYNLVLEYWPFFEDQETFLDGFLQKSRELQDKIKNVDKLKELANPFSEWIEFFIENQSPLSEPEKEYLSGALQEGLNGRFFPNAEESFELECFNGPYFTLGSLAYKFVAFDNTYLEDYAALPTNDFHDAVLAGLGVSFWYQRVLHEYYAHLTLECPQLRGFELTSNESGTIISPQETLVLETNEPSSFGYNGIFQPLTAADVREDNDRFFLHALGFRDKDKAAKVFSDLVQTYKKARDWDFPSLNATSMITPPNDAAVSKGPIAGLRWAAPSIDNPAIRMTEFVDNAETFTLILESLDGMPQPFNLSLSVIAGSWSFEAVIPALLEVACPILMDVMLVDGTHLLDIAFGTLPYTISWSNGAIGEMSQEFSPGDYEVVVTDSESCERMVSFTVPEFGTVEDIDGNSYKTVKVGNTWWMAENLRTTRKRDGTDILHLPADEDWISGQQPAFSWLENSQSYDENYGKLYNFNAACCDICPRGWRLPGIAEISELSGVFGSINPARALRAVNAWPDGSLKSTNRSGLAFLPSGFRVGTDGKFTAGQPFATFWIDYTDPYGLSHLGIIQGSVDYYTTSITTSRRDGFSVRCVKE